MTTLSFTINSNASLKTSLSLSASYVSVSRSCVLSLLLMLHPISSEVVIHDHGSKYCLHVADSQISNSNLSPTIQTLTSISIFFPIDIFNSPSETDLYLSFKPLLPVSPPKPSKNATVSYQVAKVRNLASTLVFICNYHLVIKSFQCSILSIF